VIAKRFFFVCAGILCLALACQLGTRSAAAVGVGPQGASFGYSNGVKSLSFASGRAVYGYETSQFGSDFTAVPAPGGAVPGSDEIIATLQYPGGNDDNYLVMLANGELVRRIHANGDVYESTAGGSWQLLGNFPSSVAVRSATWGAVKARYR